MPGAPWFWRTCLRARCRFARSRTRSNNAEFGIDSGTLRFPAAGSSRGSTATGTNRLSDALPLLFTRGLRLPSFGPSAGPPGLLCRLLTSPRRSAPIAQRPASILRSTAEISRGKTRHCRCIDAGFTKCIPTADGGLRGHVPARPECTTPHIRFLFIAPQLWVQLPSDPTSR